MGEVKTSPGPSETAKLISSSGCSDIQSALADMTKQGMGVDDLHPETIQTVLETMASAKSVGGHAAPVVKK